MKHRNNKGFTLIELLAVVVILGIIAVVSIVSVSKLISKSKTSQLEQQKKMILIAAKSYAQDNRIVLPKSIGDVDIVHLNDLKNGGYLKQDVKNANDEDCMIESFVKITKTSATKYNYEVFLYCGDEKAPSENEKIKPKITISFVDDEGNPADKTEVAVARFKINIKGSASRDIAIDSYSYIIMTDTGKKNSLEEAYNSGTLSGNNLYEIEVDKKLKDYIDITRATQVTIKVVARNVEGGLLDETTTLGKPEKGITYNDNVPPKCISGKTLNEADEEEWINKKDFLSEGKTRTITVFCEDGKGSGCVRDSFVRTWPNKTIKSARYGYIQVSDNAGNKHLKAASEKASNVCDASLYDKSDACVVRVNVDVVAPIIEVGAYRNRNKTIKSDVNSITGSNMLKSTAPTTTKDTEEDTATIKVDQYKNLHNDWMNFENYENGVIYKVTLKDDLHLIDWKWETNVDELDNIEDPKYEELSVDNVDGHILEKIPDTNSSINCGVTEKVIYVGFTKNGKRKGKLTVTDIAGNVSTFVIEANLDRLVPQTPEVTYFYVKNNKNYDKLNEWWKEKVKTHVKSVGEIGVSGYDRFEYLYYNDSKTKVKEENKDKCKKEDMDCFVFLADGNNEGKDYIKYRTCDVAGNCSVYSNDNFKDSVWMDTKAPTGMYVKGYKKVSTAEATRPTSYGEAPSNTWIGGYYNHNETTGNKRNCRNCRWSD